MQFKNKDSKSHIENFVKSIFEAEKNNFNNLYSSASSNSIIFNNFKYFIEPFIQNLDLNKNFYFVDDSNSYIQIEKILGNDILDIRYNTTKILNINNRFKHRYNMDLNHQYHILHRLGIDSSNFLNDNVFGDSYVLSKPVISTVMLADPVCNLNEICLTLKYNDLPMIRKINNESFNNFNNLGFYATFDNINLNICHIP